MIKRISTLMLSVVTAVSFVQVSFAKMDKTSFRILKVSRNELKNIDYGKTMELRGEKRIQKFGIKEELPENEQGEEFVVIWQNPAMPFPDDSIEIVFDFRRENATDIETQTGTVQVSRKGKYETSIQNIGNDYFERGRIESWKVSIVYNGKVVAEKASALWSE